MTTVKNGQLVIICYPRPAGGYSYAVIRPRHDDPDLYVIASSWFDEVESAKAELERMRRRERR